MAGRFIMLAMPDRASSDSDADRLDFLQAIVETTDAIVVAADAEGQIIWVNDAFVRKTGFTAKEARGRTLWSFRPPEDVEAGRQAFHQMTPQSESRRFESRWVTKDGEELLLSWSTRSVFDRNGGVRFRVGTAIDITVERRNELRALDLGEMLDQVGEAVIVVDPHSVIQYANRTAVELYRMPLEQLIGMSNRDLVPERERKKYADFISNIRRTMQPAALETWRVRGDGTEVPVELRVSPIRGEHGRLSGFIGVSYDISAELALKEQARVNEQRNAVLVKLLDNLPDPVFHMLPDGTLSYTNSAVRDVYGYRPDELVGGPMARVRPLDRGKAMAEFVQRVSESGEPGVIETQALHRDGHRIDVELRAVRIEDADGNYAGLAGFARDIGERKRHESDLRRLAETDSLTGLVNRRRFQELAEAEAKRALRYRHPIAVIACDLDRFKSINDRFGHAVGDMVLKRFAEVLLGSLRVPTDVAARLGGEEFVLMLPETDLEGAQEVAERVRRRTQEAVMDNEGELITVTVSLGVSQFHRREKTLGEAMKRADMALYEAKGAGRNRVQVSAR